MGYAARARAAGAAPGGVGAVGTIAILAHETARYAASWFDLHHLKLPGPVKTITKFNANIAEARNQCVEEMVGDWILWWDDDMRADPELLLRLLARREAIVQPVCCRRYPPFETIHMGPPDANDPTQHWLLALERGQSGLRPVHAVGAGMTLVRRFVYDRIEKPYYRNGELSPTGLAEDIGFCRRALAAGFQPFVDLDNPVEHLNAASFSPRRKPSGEWVIAIRVGTTIVAELPVVAPRHRIDEHTGEVLETYEQGAA